MKLWTYAELKAKVLADTATEDEQFISPSELLGYFNQAVDKAEQLVMTLYEDYFLNKATVTFVNGQEEYDLPEDIYAQKIRRFVFKNGSNIYEIKRMRDWKKFEAYADNSITPVAFYEYFIYSPTAGEQSKIVLSPPSQEDGPYGTLWYIRNANRFADDTDTLDIPEAANYVMAFVKTKIYGKEIHADLPSAQAELKEETDSLVDTLSSMVPDANNEIELDRSFYEEMS